MSLFEYLTGAAALLLMGASVAFVGWRLRTALLPAWSGPPAALATATGSVAALATIAQLLGAVGLFRRGAMVLACLAAAGVAAAATRGRTRTVGPAAEPPAGPGLTGRVGAVLAVVAVAVVVAEWWPWIADAFKHGITQIDSQAHHLPFAARFVQDGWVTRLHFAWLDPLWSYYPANSELLQGVTILPFHRDVLVPLVNLGWLALALLGGWCVGRPWRVAPATMTAVALVAALPAMNWTQAGSGKNDLTAIAFWVAAIAFLLNAREDERAPMVFAGLAAGLAVATKVTELAPVAALTAALVLTSRKGSRARVGASWGLPLLATGAFWYLRNLVRAGNPIPSLHLPGLPSPPMPMVDHYGFTVADYFTNGHFWRSVVPDGLALAFGPAWPAFVLLCLGGLVLALTRASGRTVKALAVAGVAGALAYLVTPLGATGRPGSPVLFWINLRYVVPSLIVGLLLLPLTPALRRGRRPWWVLLAYLGVLAAAAVRTPAWQAFPRHHLAFALIMGVATLAVFALARLPRRAVIGVMAAGLVALVAVGRPVQTRFEHGRYAGIPLAQWAATLHDARLGIVGVGRQYVLYGGELSNRVEYIGHAGDHGSFESIRDCGGFRAAVAAGGYDYVIAGSDKQALEPAPERDWLREDPNATLVLEDGSTLVFRIRVGAEPVPCP